MSRIDYDSPLAYIGTFLVVCALIGGVIWYSCRDTRTDAQRVQDQTPHVIREVDGCKVYAFESERSNHYFTRCPNSTTTHEHDWYEQEGKSSVLKKESIVTVDQ